jgi:hypothetical protein
MRVNQPSHKTPLIRRLGHLTVRQRRGAAAHDENQPEKEPLAPGQGWQASIRWLLPRCLSAVSGAPRDVRVRGCEFSEGRF